jgi:1,4-alpha-glucan branching enzyme
MTTEDSGHTARAVIGNDDWLPGQIVETPEGTVGDDTQWYRDAVIYQTHIKAFYDSNGDGVGDINGLIEKLDHIRELGATAIWLLPFYPSPLRDDGYDIQDYRTVNPSYGRMADKRRLVKAVHARGLRVAVSGFLDSMCLSVRTIAEFGA